MTFRGQGRSVDDIRADLAAAPIPMLIGDQATRPVLDDVPLRRVLDDMGRIIAGAAAEPAPDYAVPTPGQLWRSLLQIDPGRRLERLDRLLSASQDGHRCAEQNHAHRLAALTSEVHDLHAKLRAEQDANLRLTGQAIATDHALGEALAELDRPDP